MTYRNGSFELSSRAMTPAAMVILIATGVAFLIQSVVDSVTDGGFTVGFSLCREDVFRHFALWQPVTYLLVHGGLWHLLMNMIGLFFFGPETERAIGTKRFILLYFACGVLAGLGWMLIAANPMSRCLGASGAVFGILGAFAGMFPDRRVTLLVFFVLPVSMKARTMAILLGLVQLYSAVTSLGNIAYAAHLAGGVAGYLYGHAYFRGGQAGIRWAPRRWINDLLWRWQRRKVTVLPPGSGGRVDDGPAAAASDVDAILEKISRAGIGSLTQREREILEKASRIKFRGGGP